ncbi:MAG: Ig-like domain-containing protein [Prevotella sp.]|nr:Ig-like domain-containing protein [Prevotella sp.]
MKYKLLRFSLLSMLVMLFGGLASASSETETLTTNTTSGYAELTVTKAGTSSTGSDLEISKGDIVVTSDKGYIKDHEMTVYKGGTMNIGFKSGVSAYITKVELTVKNYHFAKPDGWTAEYTNDVTTKIDQADETETFTTNATDKTSFTISNAAGGKTTVKVIKVYYEKSASVDNRIATSITFDPETAELEADVNTTFPLPTAVVNYIAATGAPETLSNPAVTWKSSNESVATISEGSNVINMVATGTATITATFDGDDTYQGSSASFPLTVNPSSTALENIAALSAQTVNSDYKVTLSRAVVTYVNGNYAYIQDASGAIVMYKSGHGLTAGNVLSGTAIVTFQVRNGNPQITNLTGDYVIGDISMKTEPTEVAAASWSTPIASVLSQWFKVTGATITQEGTKFYTQLGNEKVQLYGQAEANPVSVEDLDATYTIIGFPTLYLSKNATAPTPELQIFVQPEKEESSASVTVLENIAALKAFTPSGDEPEDVVLTLTDAKVTLVDAEGDRIIFEDASAGYYLEGSGLSSQLKAGQTMNGTMSFTAEADYYGGSALTLTDSNFSTTDGELTPLEVTEDNVDDYAENYDYRLAKFTSASIKVQSGSYGDDVFLIPDVLSGMEIGIMDLFGLVTEMPADGAKVEATGWVINYMGMLTFFQPLSITEINDGPQLPGEVLWKSDQPVACNWGESNVDISVDDVKDIEIGDVIHVAVEGVSPGDPWSAQVAPYDSYWTQLENGAPVGDGTVTDASFAVTADMLKLIKANGLLITGIGCSTRLITVEKGVYEGSENSIWLGDATLTWTQAQVHNFHFINADVQAGDVIKLSYEATGNPNIQLLPDWSGANYPAPTYGDGFATVTVTDDMIVNLKGKDKGMIINADGIRLTQVELIPAKTAAPLYIIGDNGTWDRTNMTEIEFDEEKGVYEYSLSSESTLYFAFADYQMTAEEAEADPNWETFSSQYRLAIGQGNQDATLDEEVQLQKADGTIVLPAGSYSITITKDLKMTITGESTQPSEDFEYESVYVVGNYWTNSVEWDPAAEVNKMTKVMDDVWEITYELNANSLQDVNEFKFAIDGSWTHDFGGTFSGFDVETDAVYKGGNIKFARTDLPGMIPITVRLDLRNFDFTTKEGAKFTILTENAPVAIPDIASAYKALELGDDPIESVSINLKNAKVTLIKQTTADEFIGNIEGILEKYYEDGGAKPALFKAPKKDAESDIPFDFAIIEDETGAMPFIGCYLEENGISEGSVLNGNIVVSLFNDFFPIAQGDELEEHITDKMTATSLQALEVTDGTAGPTEITADNAEEYKSNFGFRYVKFSESELTVGSSSSEEQRASTLKLDVIDETVDIADFLGTGAILDEDGIVSVEGFMYNVGGIKLFQPTKMESGTNGINSVRFFENAKGAIYNLNGQRVTTPQKGVMIVNGKKVVVK